MDLNIEAGVGPAVPIKAWETLAGTSRRTVAALEYLSGHADQRGRVTVTHRGMAAALGWPVDGRGRSQAVQRAIKALADAKVISVLERQHECDEYVIEIEVDFARVGGAGRLANASSESESIPNREGSLPTPRPTAARRHSQRDHNHYPAELRALLALARPTRLRADVLAAASGRLPLGN